MKMIMWKMNDEENNVKWINENEILIICDNESNEDNDNVMKMKNENDEEVMKMKIMKA